MQEHNDAPLICASKAPVVPSGKELLGAGVGTFESQDIHSVTQPQSEQISTLLSKLDKGETEAGSCTPQPLVSLGSGLPAIPKKQAIKILANEYIDFAELPPAKGKDAQFHSHWRGKSL